MDQFRPDDLPHPDELHAILDNLQTNPQVALQKYEAIFGPLGKRSEEEERGRAFVHALWEDLERAQAMLDLDPGLLELDCGTGETPLYFLSVENELDKVGWLLARGADVNACNKYGHTPLQCAAALGNHDMMKLLVAHGGEPAPLDHMDENTLQILVGRGDLTGLRLLSPLSPAALAGGAEQGDLPLNLAVSADQLDIVEFLLSEGADPNLRDYLGWSALMDVSSIECAKMLVAAGADPFLVSPSGESVLQRASANQYNFLANWLETLSLEPGLDRGDGYIPP